MAFSGNQLTHMGIGAPISRAGRDFSGKTVGGAPDPIPHAEPADPGRRIGGGACLESVHTMARFEVRAGKCIPVRAGSEPPECFG